MYCDDAALLKLQNSAACSNNGYEAWRRFVAEWAPRARGRYRAMLQSIINFDFTASGMGEQTSLETWEALVLEYERESGSAVPDEIKAAVLTGRTDQSALAQHLSMNASRLVTYAQVRAEITGFLQAGRQWRSSPFGAVGAAATQGFGESTVPMDVDAVYQSSNATRDTVCNYCGKKGHLKRECWSYTAARQSQGLSTYKGKNDKGKGDKGKTDKGKGDKGKNDKGKGDKDKGAQK
eukprot:762842-Amphidinium_carterae.1